MDPTKIIVSFLGFSDVQSFLQASDAELLNQDTHTLHSKESRCQQQAARLRLKMEPSYIALCERFHCAKPVVKLRAMMEDMTFDQIKAELDKIAVE